MVKKIICILAAVLICVGCVKAMTPEELNKQIKDAFITLQQAELKLKLRAPRLADFWIRERTNDEGHAAEMEIRRLFPKEYKEYIDARSDLDDLLYTQYLMFVNGKAE